MKIVFLILSSCFVFYACQTPQLPAPNPESEDAITEEQLNEILEAFKKNYRHE